MRAWSLGACWPIAIAPDCGSYLVADLNAAGYSALFPLQEAAAQEAAAKGDEAEPILPRVVGEVHSPSMLELVASRWPGGVADFVLPTDFAAGILVQFALQPQVRPPRRDHPRVSSGDS